MEAKTKFPDLSVVVVSCCEVSWFVNVTSALGIAASLWSTTLPEMLPLVVCAEMEVVVNNTTANIAVSK